jgi:hypothetical protein
LAIICRFIIAAEEMIYKRERLFYRQNTGFVLYWSGKDILSHADQEAMFSALLA